MKLTLPNRVSILVIMDFRTKLPYVAILATLALFGAASFLPMKNWWGINHLAFLSHSFSYAFWAVSLLLIFLIAMSKASSTLERIIGRIDEFLWGHVRWPRLLIIVIATFVFFVFRVNTHFLGDGYTWLANLGNGEDYIHKWAEFGSIYLVRQLQSIFGGYTDESARVVFQGLSILSGAVAVYNMIAIIGRLCGDALTRTLGFATLVLSGSILLFFGYVEFYPLSWAVCAVFLNLSLRYIYDGKRLWLVLCVFALSVMMHVQALYFLGGVAFLIVHKVSSHDSRKQLSLILTGLAVAIVAVVVSLQNTKIDIEVLFLPLLAGRPVAPDYTLLSLIHIFDLGQELFLVYPGIAVIMTVLMLQRHKLKKDATSVFLALLSLGSLVFLFTYGAAITMARDWDIMSLTLLMPICMILYQLNDNRPILSGKLVVSYTILISLIVGSFLAVETNRESSEDRFYSLLNSRDRSSWTILSNYFYEQGNIDRAVDLSREMNNVFPDYVELDRAHSLIDSGDLRGAQDIARRLITKNSYNPDFLHLMAKVYSKTGQYDQAEKYYKLAVKLRPYMAPLRNKLGQLYMKQQRYDEALVELKIARKIAPSLTNIAESVGLTYFYLGHYDSALAVADTLLSKDRNSPGGHLLYMVVAVRDGDMIDARNHFQEYLKYGKTRSDYNNLREYYSYLLE